MILPIYLYGSEVLRRENVDADLNDKEGITRLLEDMKETLKVADGCGLAAPQVGVSLRLFVIDASPMTDDENDIYVEKWADIQKYVSQMYTAFLTGDADINAQWDEYVANIDQMGLPEVLECYEAALARYNAWQEG